MKSISVWFDEYAESHQNPVNKAIHWVCIPVIFITILGLFSAIPAGFLRGLFPEPFHPYVNWGNFVLSLALLFYLVHSFSIFIGMVFWSIFCVFAVKWLGSLPFPLWASSLVLFALAWIGQFYGHHIEGKKPSFFKDVQFLLIGPAWLLSFIYRKAGLPY